MTRAITDRVRNDGNWIYGNPYYRGKPGDAGSMMNVTHIIGAPPIPEFEGWTTPRYGFELSLLPGAPRTMHMSYHLAKEPAAPEPIQLALFELQTA